MFNVGDVVRVRQWDDMADEFCVDCDGDILVKEWYFRRDMIDTCGKEAIIARVYNSGDWFELSFDDDSLAGYEVYGFESSMIESVIQASEALFNETEFVSLISEL